MLATKTLLFLFGTAFVCGNELRHEEPCGQSHIKVSSDEITIDDFRSPEPIEILSQSGRPPFLSHYVQEGTNLFYKPHIVLTSGTFPSMIGAIMGAKPMKEPSQDIPEREPILADEPAIPVVVLFNEEPEEHIPSEPLVIPPAPQLPPLPELPAWHLFPVVTEKVEIEPDFDPKPSSELPPLPHIPNPKPFVIPPAPQLPPLPELPAWHLFPVVTEKVEIEPDFDPKPSSELPPLPHIPNPKPFVIPPAPQLPPLPELPAWHLFPVVTEKVEIEPDFDPKPSSESPPLPHIPNPKPFVIPPAPELPALPEFTLVPQIMELPEYKPCISPLSSEHRHCLELPTPSFIQVPHIPNIEEIQPTEYEVPSETITIPEPPRLPEPTFPDFFKPVFIQIPSENQSPNSDIMTPTQNIPSNEQSPLYFPNLCAQTIIIDRVLPNLAGNKIPIRYSQLSESNTPVVSSGYSTPGWYKGLKTNV